MPQTRRQRLLAYAKAARTGNSNTGRKNYKGRAIYQGPRGGLFVRVKSRKVYKIRQ